MYHVLRHSVSARHPLNVKPLGNEVLSDPQEQKTKSKLMGDFSRFSDETIMMILGHISNEKHLLALAHTSRVMYAYTYDEELWRRLYFSKIGANSFVLNGDHRLQNFRWRGSWRNSVLGIGSGAGITLPGSLVCSDLLYRPYQCSQIDYSSLFYKVIRDETARHNRALTSLREPSHERAILRLADSGSYEYEKLQNKPFILVSEPGRWPNWDLDHLVRRFPDVVFRQEAAQWPLSLYAEYLRNNCDESPLYLFDCKSDAMKTLKQEYTVPPVFQDDLFSVFEKVDCRPDHAWLIVGPLRSGSTFHKDPNYTSAWNAALSGRKLWVMLPPHIVPPGVGTDDDESEVTSPVGIAEWVLAGFFNDAATIDECIIAVTFPGECMHVPAGWWHSVINIDDSVALTQNFAPSSKVQHTLDFFKTRTGQVSGFTIKRVYKAISTFLDKYQGDDNEDIEALTTFRSTIATMDIDQIADEDCGELDEMPTMPIYEFFRLLLISEGKGHLLETSQTRKPSHAWTKVVDGTGFTFGFDVE